MDKLTVYFARFWSPGSFIADSWTKDIDEPDPAKIEWPERAYAFEIFQREDVHDGSTIYRGEATQVGPMYYHPDSKVETLAEARTNPKVTPTLISNMQCNKWPEIVWTRWGNWPQPFDKQKAQVLPRWPGMNAAISGTIRRGF